MLGINAPASNQIALDCGYGDQAAFTLQFRKSVGLTPRAYRDRHRSGPSAGQ
jgi:AraC-like DNA-binding protein